MTTSIKRGQRDVSSPRNIDLTEEDWLCLKTAGGADQLLVLVKKVSHINREIHWALRVSLFFSIVKYTSDITSQGQNTFNQHYISLVWGEIVGSDFVLATDYERSTFAG